MAIYSRNREDVTESFPELRRRLRSVGEAAVGGLIFDGEILGWDYATRRAGAAVCGAGAADRAQAGDQRGAAAIPVVFMAFDLMFADGELQLDLPLRERRKRLEASWRS